MSARVKEHMDAPGSSQDFVQRFFATLDAHARGRAPSAVVDGQRAWSYGELAALVEQCADTLKRHEVRVLASRLDNGMAWIVTDLAALRAGVVHVPVPAFFSDAQVRHVLDATQADASIGMDGTNGMDGLVGNAHETVHLLPGTDLALVMRRRGHGYGHEHGRNAAPALPKGTSKLSFTSGSTGTPKGACLDARAMLEVARGVAEATAHLDIERHLCALPYAVLLENIAGVFAPLWRGATVIALPMTQVGLRGASAFDPALFDAVCRRTGAHSAILLPQMLRAWSAWLDRAGRGAPLDLRLVAVGGAAVGCALLNCARTTGIPAYEGYGLTEGASVQTLNLPGADRAGSAGRPLPHARLRIAADGEVEIAGSLFLGYLGEAQPPRSGQGHGQRGWWPTGDLGEIDADGYLHVLGRKKNVLITAFGRNVSPEWIETLLNAQPCIAQAVVCGDGRPALAAVIWPVPDGVVNDAADRDMAIARSIEGVNALLPDYARIAHWVHATVPFTSESGMATANGRPLRAAIEARHHALLYPEPLHAASAHAMQPGSGLVRHSTSAREHMEPFEQLQKQTQEARATLLAAPVIHACLRGEVALGSYTAFLAQAYHHVRHTVPLLLACRAALPGRLGWLRDALDEYIEEEAGHDEWVLADLTACGLNAAAVRAQNPAPATRRMVEHAYALIAHGKPLGFLGMVHVLEGTSVALALQAADSIQTGLGLPDHAFSYLRSHGTLDRSHTEHFRALVNRLDDKRDLDMVIEAARDFYFLYGDIFRGLPIPGAALAAQ